jgi:ABC-type lipoprotein release transport system permease subunit
MRSLTRGNIKTALNSIRTSKWRSLLTMLGIIIGIVSVVTVVSIGEGVKRQVVSQINQLGKDLITVRPGQLVNRDDEGRITGVNLFSGLSSTGSLTDKDVEAIRKVPGVQRAVPLSIVAGPVTFEDKKYNNVAVIGTTPELPQVLKQKIEFGGFFNAIRRKPERRGHRRRHSRRCLRRRHSAGPGFHFPRPGIHRPRRIRAVQERHAVIGHRF